MSAIDRGSGSSMEEPERPEGPLADADGRESVTDHQDTTAADTPEDATTGSAARSETGAAPDTAQAASAPSAAAAPASEPAASAAEQRDASHEAPAPGSRETPPHPAPRPAPFAPQSHAPHPAWGPPAPDQATARHGAQAYPGPEAPQPAPGRPGPPPAGGVPAGAAQGAWQERPAQHDQPNSPTGAWAVPPSPGGFFPPTGGFPTLHGSSPFEGAPPPGKPQRSGRVVLIAAVTALITSLIVGPAASVATAYFLSEQVAANPAATSAASGDVTKVAAKALPSVVSIATAEGGGSGFIIRDDGLIVTNNHVVSDAQELTVLFHDGSQASATIVGTDPVSDLAVIRAQGVSGLTPASLGDSDQVEVGAEVVAIGAPLGLSGTVTLGVVSAVERPVNTGVSGQQDSPLLPSPDEEEPQATTSTVIDAIQTDAPINPGNSGGPLVNMNGEVIGINTAIATTSGNFMSQSGSIGLGFAIPINQAKPIIEELINTGKATYAAIEASVTVAEDGPGAELVEVNRGGAADQAGLRKGDVIIRIEDRMVTDPNVLIAEIRSHRPGDTVTITYQRGGQTAQTTVTLAAQSLDN